jgi:serine/threonine-protein phosphatase PP1 catalytic subunit
MLSIKSSITSDITLKTPAPPSQANIKFQLDDIIKFLFSFDVAKPARLQIPIPMLAYLSKIAKILFEREPALLHINGSYHLFGDIHGQYVDMLRFLSITGIPPKANLIFLGDYVDRGYYSVEVVALLFALKIKYPANVFIIRGNHECAEVNKGYGFYDECVERYGGDNGLKVWKTLNNTLHCLPIAIVLNDAVFCVHGGISPNIKSLDDIASCSRGTCIPNDGILCDLTWSDPKARQKTEWADNDRGVSYTFNEKALENFLKTTGLQMVCRAHQVVKNGYEFYGGTLITVFSAPNYCGDVGNNGAVLFMNDNLEFSFIIIKPIKPTK